VTNSQSPVVHDSLRFPALGCVPETGEVPRVHIAFLIQFRAFMAIRTRHGGARHAASDDDDTLVINNAGLIQIRPKGLAVTEPGDAGARSRC